VYDVSVPRFFRSVIFFWFAVLAVCATAAQLKPLSVVKSGRYFNAGSKPWFWMGDTAWPLGVIYKPSEVDTYLDARAKSGFTLIQMSAIWDGGTGTESGPKPNPNFAGEAPWRNHDPLQPNEAYWRNIDSIVAKAAKHGIYIGLLPTWGSFVVELKTINAGNAEQYGQWLGTRYKNMPNIVWIVGGDRDPSKMSDVWRAIAHGLQSGDGGIHPITFHPNGGHSSDFFAKEPWLAANMIQTWASYPKIPEVVAHDYNSLPTKPVILGEGAYEDGPEYPTKPITPLIVRKQAYWAYLSGGFFTYGHNSMWRYLPIWRESLHSEGAQDMAILKHIFTSLDWWNLMPDNSILGDATGTGREQNAAARASNGNWAMVYFSHPLTARLDLKSLARDRFTATWIDPRSGKKTNAGSHTRSEAASWSVPASWQDGILLIRCK
jgi:hypothetical protein